MRDLPDQLPPESAEVVDLAVDERNLRVEVVGRLLRRRRVLDPPDRNRPAHDYKTTESIGLFRPGSGVLGGASAPQSRGEAIRTPASSCNPAPRGTYAGLALLR